MGQPQDLLDSARVATGDAVLAAGLFTPALLPGPDPSPPPGSSRRHDPAPSPWRAGPGGHRRIVVAVAPEHVYLLAPVAPGTEVPCPLSLVHTFDQRRVAATIHTRLGARTLTLEDTWTGERFDLEADRSPGGHVTATMHALSDLHELAS